MAFEASRVQQELGNHLRRIRGGRTLEEVAPHVGMDRRTLARKEKGEIGITIDEVLALCAFYGADGPETALLSEMARSSRSSRWWKELEDFLEPNYYRQIGLENDAVRVISFRPSVVHGLLQTEEYMRAVFASSGNSVDTFRKKANMRARLGRQRRLHEPDNPLMLDVIMDDSVLRKDFGDSRALLGQLKHLLRMASLPNVTIRLVPNDAPVVFEQAEGFEFGALGGAAVAVVESIFGVVIIENELQVEQTLAMIDHVSTYARNAEQTAEVISKTIKELELVA